MESVVKGIAQSFGATTTFDYRPTLPSVYNHPEFGQTMLPTLIGILGKDKVLPLQPQMVAEDFSFYAQKIPGFFFFLGVNSPSQATTAALHSPNFNPDERSIAVGIKLMCHLLLDSLDKQNSLESPPSSL